MTALHVAGGGLPLALHIPHVVEQAGSIAGFAAVLGLAVLSALYFSQARDLRRLREWAGRAPERAAEAQPAAAVPGRVVAVPQQQRPPQAPAQAAVAPAAAAAAAGAAAGGPGNGAPATDAAKAGQGEKPAEAGAATANGDSAPSVAAAKADAEKAKDGEETKHGQAPSAEPAKPGMP